MFRTSRQLPILSAVLAVCLIAAACGDDAGEDPADSQAPAVSEEAAAADTDSASEADSTAEAPDDADTMDDTETPDDAGTADDAAPDAAEPAPEEPKAPIKFGAINMQDGVIAFPEVGESIEIWVDYWNANGGINGHPVELELCTAGDDAESALACAQRFANDDSVEFVYLGVVINSAAVYETLGPAGVNKPMLGNLLFDVPDQLQPGLYSTDPGTLALAYEALRYAVEEGTTSMAVVVDDSDVGEATLGLVDFVFSSLGGETTTAVKVATGQADFLPALTAAGVADTQGLILLIGESAACQPTRDGLEALGLGDLPVYLGEWCVGEEFREAGTSEGWRTVIGHNGPLFGSDPDSDLVHQVYDDAGAGKPFGLILPNLVNMDFAFQVLEAAAAEAGGLPTAEQVHAAATARPYELLLGPTVSCPGPGLWVSTCNSGARVITLEDGQWVGLSPFNAAPMTFFDVLLEG